MRVLVLALVLFAFQRFAYGQAAASESAASSEKAGQDSDQLKATSQDAREDQPAGKLPAVFEGVGIDEQSGERIPLDLEFLDEDGNPVTLSSFFDGERPVVLNFVYHNCPMLCSLLVENMTKTLKKMKFTPGTEFDILTVSFSETETPDLASRQKARYLGILDRAGAASGWHFLTGTFDNIQTLARATGFKFHRVEETGEYAHPAALIFLSGDGTITRYLHGMSFTRKDLRTAIVEASEGKVGNTIDQIFLYCYKYDANANSYVLQATRVMKLGGYFTLIVVAMGLFMFWRREHRRHPQMPSDT